MIKFIAMLFAVFFLSNNSYAQGRKITVPMLCETADVVKEVLDKYKEEQLFLGQDEMHQITDMNVLLFLNNKTGTYSLLFVGPSSNMICIISSGTKGKILYKD